MLVECANKREIVVKFRTQKEKKKLYPSNKMLGKVQRFEDKTNKKKTHTHKKDP